VFTADEEIGCIGAKHLADLRPFIARHSIVGEPTSLQPIRAGKGYCLSEITVHGHEGHSAHPERGASAIFRAARLINSIERVAVELQSDAHPAFDPPHTTVNVGLIRGGTAKNVLAGECQFTLEWRPIPHQDPHKIVRAIETEIARLKSDDADFDATVEVTRIDGGIETPEDAALVRWMEEVSGKSCGTVAFGTEAPQMKRLGAEAIVYGPGDIRVAHTDREYVPQAELERCAIVLREAIMRFCA
jgi:acetylornithine deacetylase